MSPQPRRSNADRALDLVEWGMQPKNRGKAFSKVQMAAAIGMGAGDHFDRVLGAARALCNERGHNLGFFYPCLDGTYRAAFTKTDPKLPLPGVRQRVSQLTGQMSNVRKQVVFVERHSGHDAVARHVTEIVKAVEANTMEANALLRIVIDRLTDEDD